MTSVLGNGVFAVFEPSNILEDIEITETDEFGVPLRSFVVSNSQGFLQPKNTFSIPINELENFFAVYGEAQSKNGTASIITTSNNLRLLVDSGEPEIIRATISECLTSDVDMFPETITQPGTVQNPQNPFFAGVLYKDDDSYFKDGKYIQWYSITDDFKYYFYEVTVQYTENVPSEVTISSPENYLFTNKDKLFIDGNVTDKNNGDKIDIFYSFKKVIRNENEMDEEDEDSIFGKTLQFTDESIIIENCTDTYTVLEHPFTGSIDISSLEDGEYTVDFWGIDKNQASSKIVTISFTVDRTPPGKPIITQEPDNDTPTNDSVIVEIEYPDDPAEKKYKVGEDDDWKDYEGPIEVDENDTIYAKSEDEAGNESEIAEHEVTNIDTTPPGPPTITTSADSTIEKPIYVTIEPGIDEGSGVNRVEFRLYDPNENIEIDANVYDETDETNEDNEDDETDETDNDDETDETDNDDETDETDEDEETDETDETDNDDEADETDETDETDEDNEADETGDDDETDETDLPKWTVYKGEFEITRIGTTRIIARTIDNAGNISEEAIKDVKIDKKPTPKPTTPPKDNDRPPSGGGGGGGKTDPDDDDTVKKPDTTVPGATTGSPVDLAVFLHTDKSIYGEGEIITFTIEYKNKSSNTAYGVAIEAEIPNNTTLDNASEGEVDKNKITWKIGTVSGKDSGKIEYTVKVNELDKAEIKATNTATISFTNSALNPDDDSSTISFLLYSDRFKDNFHSKYIYGYEDNTFRPGNNITRAEVAAIMFNILDLKEDNTVVKDYPDLADSHWAYKQIQAVTGANIFTGYEDGSFRPDNYITRAEFATVLANHLGLKNVESLKVNFADIQGHWAKNFIEEIYRVKLIQGYIENDVRVFKPDNHITRAEAVTIINNMLFRGPLLGASAPFDDVAENHWAHGHILESSIDHYYTRNDDETESIVKEEE
jgi:uncharacterized repeat protein (TIGR01451 family)